MRSVFFGDILSVRAIEDSIRATRKYTKGAFSRPKRDTMSVQGEDFPSRVLTEYYEVYPDLELHWDMSAARAWRWVWGDVTHIDVRFQYDYREGEAKVTVSGGPAAVSALAKGIPGLQDLLVKITEIKEAHGGQGNQEQQVVGGTNRARG